MHHDYAFNPATGRLDLVPPRAWGSFWDTTIQTAAAIETGQPIQLGQSDPLNLKVDIVSGSRVTFRKSGVYSITFSAQLVNADSQIQEVDIWARKNDGGPSGDIANTNSRFSVTEKHGSVNGHIVATVNYVFSLQASDYIELIWSTSNLLTKIETLPSNSVHPASPGIILTAARVA